MSASTLLEIQNRTPFPMTWAHLARPDDEPGRTPENLLDVSIPSHRRRLIGAVEPGRVHLVLGFQRADAGNPARVESEPRILGPDEAWSACIEYSSERDVFRVRWIDARVPEREHGGDRPPAGPYRWQGRRGTPRYKRTETERRGNR